MSELIPIECEARLMGMSKVDRKDGEWTQLTFQVHPNDTPYALYLLPLKTHVMLAIKGVEDAEKPQEERSAEPTQTPEEPEKRTLPLKERRSWGELSATTQAVLACKREDFQRWICLKNGDTPPCEDNAVWHVKQYCGVTSRRQLTTTSSSERLWCGLWDDFKASIEGRTDADLKEQARL